MRFNPLIFSFVTAIISGVGNIGETAAYSSSYSFTWAAQSSCPKLNGGSVANPNYGKNAGSCTFIYPDNHPFTQAKTLIVDNHLPIGAVLYSWDYNEFLPDFGWHCTSSGITQCANTVKTNTGVTINNLGFSVSTYLLGTGAVESSPGIYKTSIEGIGIKLYLKVSGDTAYNRGTCNSNEYIRATSNGMTVNDPAAGSEIVVGGSSHPWVNLQSALFCDLNTDPNVPGLNKFTMKGRATFSVRAELIKTGDVTSSGALSIKGANTGSTQVRELGQIVFLPPFLDGNLIVIQQPSCRLRGATDYQINLGRWGDNSSHGGLPVIGAIHPIGLNLECSGKLDNVEFSFQDTGVSPLSNRNVSVYDGTDGQPIDGLEIEMTYSGNRLDIHKISESPTSYKTNTGAHGSIKTNTSDLSFSSQSQAQFGARFIQRGPIKRNGHPYTGPITGKVNMFITYY
ncbi:hypothetical protein ACISK3_09860 [Morganella morganii]|nr:hypothetical protein [Morganella morganii]